jgi:hypothetical protein
MVSNIIVRSIASDYNYIVNGGMIRSAEHGDNALTTSGKYPTDQWHVSYAIGTGAISYSRVHVTTPRGSKSRLRFSVTTAKASVAANEQINISQALEGIRILNLIEPSGGLRQAVVSIGVNAPAGVYGFSLCNKGAVNSCISSFTVSPEEANTDVYKQFVIPYPLAWGFTREAEETLTVRIAVTAGTLFQKPFAGSYAGNFLSTSDITNSFLAKAGNKFELFDVGLYEGIVAPPFVVPNVWVTEDECFRFFEVGYADALANATSAGIGVSCRAYFVRKKRTYPTIVLTDIGSSNVSGTVAEGLTAESFRIYTLSAAAGWAIVRYQFIANARM